MRRQLRILLGALLIGPLVAEGAARVLNLGPESAVGTLPGLFAVHGERGFTLRPDATATGFGARGAIEVTTDARGLRAMAQSPTGDDAKRILALGDDQTFGLGVEVFETWPSVLEGLLNASGHPVRVLNASVPGYDAAQEASLLADVAPAWKPDLVVWAPYLGNDVSALWSRRAGGWTSHAGMLVEDDGRALLGVRTWLHRNSRAWRAFVEPRLGTAAPVLTEEQRRAEVREALAWDQGFALALARKEPTEGVAEAWLAFEAALERVCATCEQLGARLVLVPLPAPLQIHSALWVEVHGRTHIDPAEYDLGRPQTRFAELAAARELRVHDPAAQLRSWAEAAGQTSNLPYAGIQLSQWGHRLVGQLLAKELVADGAL